MVRSGHANSGAAGGGFAYEIAARSTDVYVAGSDQRTLGAKSNAFVRKYDAEGNEVWTRRFGSSYVDYASGVAVDSTGVYVAGSLGDLSDGSNVANQDAFLRKYDAEGTEVWTRQFGTSEQDYAVAVAVVAGSVYMSGVTRGALPGQSVSGDNDAFVRKYDTERNEVWTRQFGSSRADLPSGLAADASGVYVAGRTWATLPGQASSWGESDAFVRKYDTQGNEVWTRQFGTSLRDEVNALVVDSSGIYVAGATQGSLPGQTSAGGWDAFVRKYDADGNEVWTRQVGTSGWDFARVVAANANGIYLGGQTEGILQGKRNAGHYDAFVRAYDAEGNGVWTRQFGSADQDEPSGLAVDSHNVYLAGTTWGTLPGQTRPGGPHAAFVRKYGPEGN